jgi:hypothetical protein
MIRGMKPPLSVRPLTLEERQLLEAGLHSAEAFTLRRCQMLLASARGQDVRQIAHTLGWARQSVRNAIRDCHCRGGECLPARSSRPQTAQPVFARPQREALQALLHESPRTWGKPRSLWTVGVAAQVCWEQGLPPQPVSIETIRQALARRGVRGRRAKPWLPSPEPQYALKKHSATA